MHRFGRKNSTNFPIIKKNYVQLIGNKITKIIYWKASTRVFWTLRIFHNFIPFLATAVIRNFPLKAFWEITWRSHLGDSVDYSRRAKTSKANKQLSYISEIEIAYSNNPVWWVTLTAIPKHPTQQTSYRPFI